MTSNQPLFAKAVREFWGIRTQQGAAQRARGSHDQGARSDVTGGRHLDGFLVALTDQLVRAGVERKNIFTQKGKTPIPGYFRATKAWDLLVIREGQLLVAIEVKSISSSFGNNLNNRTEEALGNATDLWTAYREEVFGVHPPPLLGYLFVVAETDKSTSPVRTDEPHFQVMEDFKGASYLLRAEILCKRLLLERHYGAACLIATDPSKARRMSANYREPSPSLSAASFVAAVVKSATG